MRRWAVRLLPVLVIAAAAWVLWFSIVEGRAEQRAHPGLKLGAAPLVGRDQDDGWEWRVNWSIVGSAAVGAAVVWAWWQGWWQRVRQRWVVLAAAVGAMAFSVALALADGLEGLTYGADHETEYLANLADAPPAGEFVRTFVDRIDDYTVHVRGHPPGFVLLLKAMAAIGLHGVWPVVVVTILATGVTAAAVLVAVRAVAGEVWMRGAAPFLIVSPYAIWMVTSGDAVFTCLGALGVAAIAEGVDRVRRGAVLLGLAAGGLLGVLLFMTYLGGVFLVLPAVVLLAAWRRHASGVWLVAAGGVAAGLLVIGAFWAAGFWWFDGVEVTKREYYEGSAQFRSWAYFSIGNLGAGLFSVGPAAVVGLAMLRHRRIWLLVGGGLAALTASHLTRYTKGEVERIWLLFYPWIVLAASALVVSRRRWIGTAAVAAQAVAAIVLQAALLTKW